MKKNTFYILLMLFVILFNACKKDEDEQANVTFNFSHEIDGSPVIFDSLMYVNAAENHYLITEIQYFISDITFYKSGQEYAYTTNEYIKYLDTNIPSTLTWAFPAELRKGNYDSLSFTFGIDSVKNVSNMFVNPPERDMFWPEMMGGGYHYMKLNGKWIPDSETQPQAFNIHLGIGQIYANDTSSTVERFVQNYFKVTIHQSFKLSGKTNNIGIVMDVNSWFDTPEVYDFDHWGAHIMQNQNAMHTICLNGKDVFSLRQYLIDK